MKLTRRARITGTALLAAAGIGVATAAPSFAAYNYNAFSARKPTGAVFTQYANVSYVMCQEIDKQNSFYNRISYDLYTREYKVRAAGKAYAVAHGYGVMSQQTAINTTYSATVNYNCGSRLK